MAMSKVKRMLAPVQGISFDEICAFTTETWVGLYDYSRDEWVVFPKEDVQFSSLYLGNPDTLDELDDKVFSETDEHIEAVSRNSNYTFILKDAEEK